MRLAVHQPYFFPWPGYFHKMMSVDMFAIMDDVQYTHREYFNRCRILVGGKPAWMTIPVSAKWKQIMADVKISNAGWIDKHIKTMCMHYTKAPHSLFVTELFKGLQDIQSDKLVDYTIPTIESFSDILGINSEIVLESSIDYEPALKTQRIINVCKAVGADTYVAGSGGSKKYLDVDQLRDNGIDVEWQSFKYRPYEQIGSNEFVPGLSILDTWSSLGSHTKSYIIECGKTERAT